MDIHELTAIAKRVHDAEGVNIGSGSTREYRNRFWARVVGIAHHGHPVYNRTPDPQWHLKDGGGGRPQSDDVAVSMPSRHFWDCIPSAGADGYRFEASGDHGPLPPEQNVYPPPVPDGGGGVVTPPPSSDIWTPAHEAIRVRMAGRSAVNLAEQLAHSFPDEQWGQKRTSGGDWSPDTIGRLVGGVLWAVRVIPAVTIYGFLPSGHVHRQVPAVNHLGEAPPVVPPVTPPVTPPPVVVPPVDPGIAPALVAIHGRLSAIEAAIATQREEVLAAVRGQSYEIDANVRMLGPVRGTITPKGQA